MARHMDGASEVTSPAREMAVTVNTYAEAQRVVDFLAEQKFPVERVAIIADGLRLVEQVTGRASYGTAALQGAFSGALTGAFFGFIFGLLSLITPLVSALNLALYGLFYGAIVGAILGLVFYTLSSGRRDFTSVSGIQADHYHVMTEWDLVGEARTLLQRMSSPDNKM